MNLTSVKRSTSFWLSALWLLQVAKLNSCTTIEEADSGSFNEAFCQINKLLLENVSSDDYEPNLRALEPIEEFKKSDIPNLAEAVLLFGSLRSLLNHEGDGEQQTDVCPMSTYEILSTNLAALEAANKVSGEKRLTRIEKVIKDLCLEQANECLKEKMYLTIFNGAYQMLDLEQVVRVETLVDLVIAEHSFLKTRLFGMKRIAKLYNDFISKPNPVMGTDDTKIHYRALEHLTRDDPDKKYLKPVADMELGRKAINEPKIKDLFNKYLIDPCSYYVDELGPDLFQLASFNIKFKPHDLNNVDPNNEQSFYYGWARYKYCESLIQFDRATLIKKLIAKAEFS